MGCWSKDIRTSQNFWDRNRSQPNGQIIDVNWRDRFVTVSFEDGALETYEFNDFRGYWTDKFGGGWDIPE